jgi:hypothetical protein
MVLCADLKFMKTHNILSLFLYFIILRMRFFGMFIELLKLKTNQFKIYKFDFFNLIQESKFTKFF